MNVIYGCVTNSAERLAKYVLPRIGDRQLIALWGQTSMTEGYNTILAAVRLSDLDMLVLLHDDLELIDPDGEDKLLAAVREPGIALAGVAGGRGVPGLNWWDGEAYGHQLIDTGMLTLGPLTGDVDSLEGSIMAFSPWAVANLRFDRRYTGFHGYDDIGMCARAAGRRVVVADVDTHHHTRLGFTSPESAQAWHEANRMFKAKWGLA